MPRSRERSFADSSLGLISYCDLGGIPVARASPFCLATLQTRGLALITLDSPRSTELARPASLQCAHHASSASKPGEDLEMKMRMLVEALLKKG